MITNDPLQTQLSLGAYAGANPFGLPYTTQQTGFNPAQFNPLAGVGQTAGISPFGQQGYGGIPYVAAIAQQQQLQQLQQLQQQIQQQIQQQQQQQQLQQLASILASQGAIPQLFAQTTPLGQTTPWQTNVLQNPLINPQLINPMLAQQLALQAASVYGQSQFGQVPFAQGAFAQGGFPLAPQSWVGQQVPGQIHPHHLSQLAARGLY